MISYTITVCNEHSELLKLLYYLKDKITEDDEVVIQMDEHNVTDEVRNVIENNRHLIKNLTVTMFPLDKDFSKFKNNLKNHCKKDWIFNIDADEMPSQFLINNIHQILKDNSDVEMMLVPRWNIVDGITDEHIVKWNWKHDEFGRINWPDYQTRIYRNTENIVWKNKVHERLSGYKSHSSLPAEDEFCLYHVKSIDRQEKQNEFYSEI